MEDEQAVELRLPAEARIERVEQRNARGQSAREESKRRDVARIGRLAGLAQ